LTATAPLIPRNPTSIDSSIGRSSGFGTLRFGVLYRWISSYRSYWNLCFGAPSFVV
jgi:hypothetical protein